MIRDSRKTKPRTDGSASGLKDGRSSAVSWLFRALTLTLTLRARKLGRDSVLGPAVDFPLVTGNFWVGSGYVTVFSGHSG